MLETLCVRDFVIVRELAAELRGGFTALTGETGAGKSILLDALTLVLGARADSGVVRVGCQRAEVGAAFAAPEALGWLASNGFPEDGTSVLIRRTIDTSGRSRGWINGSPATMAQLRELGGLLVDIHGQNEHQSLVHAQAQLSLLDGCAGLEADRGRLAALYSAWKAAQDALAAAERRGGQLRAEQERLTWILSELQALAPKAGEYEEIGAEHGRLSNASSITEAVTEALGALHEGTSSASDQAGHAEAVLTHAGGWDPRLAEIAQSVSQARSVLEDSARDLERYLEHNTFDEATFAQLDERLSAYFSAGRKFHRKPEELAGYMAECQQRLARTGEALDTEPLKKAERAAWSAYEAAACRLTAARKAAAERFSSDVTAAMQGLAMAGGQFAATIAPCEAGAAGMDRCEFLVAGHPGVPLRPLSKVASGGELARIGLAIAVISAEKTPTGTLIFDEVDTGIGGGVAETVGRRLASLGQHRQVLCVTHLPQVASRADHHWSVSKRQESDGTTLSHMTELTDAERVREIARMLGGLDMTATTLAHAREMLGSHTE